VAWIGLPTGVAVIATDPDAVIRRTTGGHERHTICRIAYRIATGLKRKAIGLVFGMQFPTAAHLPDGQITQCFFVAVHPLFQK
jgi:hypothetical protein